MASQKSARRSRKRRSSAPPRAVRSQRRERTAAVQDAATRQTRQDRRSAGSSTYGERPTGLFGGLPVSEVSILAGAVAVIVGWLNGSPVTLIVGVGICFLAVLEITAREHFSG